VDDQFETEKNLGNFPNQNSVVAKKWKYKKEGCSVELAERIRSSNMGKGVT